MRQFITYSVLLVSLCGLLFAQEKPTARKVLVVDKVTQTARVQEYGTVSKGQEAEHHSAPVVMAEFMKRCPGVSFTENREDAEFVLKTQPGGSTLSNPKGEILYISPAKTLGNMVKDVCTYIAAH
jgi:hypothetical protein